MKKLTVCCLALILPMTLIAADRDVNRDGRTNQADVTALARMVAGLDPVDLRFDQNGDHVLNLDDVNHLLDAIPPDSGAGIQAPDTGQGPASNQTTGNIAFYAIRQKNTGQCAVVAGGEGISPGDTVFGVFPSFPEAQNLLTNRCGPGNQTTPTTHVPPGLPLSNDRLYRPDETITRGKWGTATHINEDANLKKKVNERGLVIEDGFFVAPGVGGPTEILWSHDGSDLMFSGVATVIDCIDYCGGAGSIEFFVRGDGRDLWTSGMVRQADPARPFSLSLSGIRDIRLVITNGGNGGDEDWGGWFNLKIGSTGTPGAATTAGLSTGINAGVTGSPKLAIPRYDYHDATRGIFVIDLKNGHASMVDRVKTTSLEIRSRPFPYNVFTALGRSLAQPALNGQILAGPIHKGNGEVHAVLLVDTTTGAMAYVTEMDGELTKFRIKRFSNLPAEHLADSDGNFALVMRREASGKTVAAYLYHGTTGQCALFNGLDDLATDITGMPTTSLPTTVGNVSSVALQGGSDATTHFLLIDNENGKMSLVGGVKRKPTQLTVKTLSRNLVSSFPKDTPVATPIRFVPVAVTTRSGSTNGALILDVASGSMAILEHLTEPSKLRLVGVNHSIYGLLPANVGQARSISAVPKVDDSGVTVGVWFFDNASEKILFLNDLQNSNNLKLREVEIGGGG